MMSDLPPHPHFMIVQRNRALAAAADAASDAASDAAAE